MYDNTVVGDLKVFAKSGHPVFVSWVLDKVELAEEFWPVPGPNGQPWRLAFLMSPPEAVEGVTYHQLLKASGNGTTMRPLLVKPQHVQAVKDLLGIAGGCPAAALLPGRRCFLAHPQPVALVPHASAACHALAAVASCACLCGSLRQKRCPSSTNLLCMQSERAATAAAVAPTAARAATSRAGSKSQAALVATRDAEQYDNKRAGLPTSSSQPTAQQQLCRFAPQVCCMHAWVRDGAPVMLRGELVFFGGRSGFNAKAICQRM